MKMTMMRIMKMMIRVKIEELSLTMQTQSQSLPKRLLRNYKSRKKRIRCLRKARLEVELDLETDEERKIARKEE